MKINFLKSQERISSRATMLLGKLWRRCVVLAQNGMPKPSQLGSE